MAHLFKTRNQFQRNIWYKNLELKCHAMFTNLYGRLYYFVKEGRNIGLYITLVSKDFYEHVLINIFNLQGNLFIVHYRPTYFYRSNTIQLWLFSQDVQLTSNQKTVHNPRNSFSLQVIHPSPTKRLVAKRLKPYTIPRLLL